ncbi:peroxiredoxin family protein [Jeotgalibacillus haloalkalitolerans]|uniref:TlpA disulfide reductase family protein n=1 Tax=Jeotgalibacillus haloalkalitolerans TaxID=3104292 RepID=A0ABU5KIM7_9BACL|nr:TlpA disulfide reductase family protein [Jeotgalibacillus sp. HH7-29]MDZ5710626.1 TlpA disulfide reductase family protein [Jeotgalibacillus sp. HH7-29]
MIPRLLALGLVGVLVALLIVNVMNDQKERQELQALQEEYAVAPADNESAAPVESSGAVKEGNTVPSVEVTTLDGETVNLADYRGKKVILNFWATWCPPCMAEMPHMQEYYENEAGEQNVEILAVNLTSKDNGMDRIESFVEDYELTFPILLDETGAMGDEFQAFFIPTTYLIDEEGVIQRKLMGPMDRDMMVDMMEEL